MDRDAFDKFLAMIMRRIVGIELSIRTEEFKGNDPKQVLGSPASKTAVSTKGVRGSALRQLLGRFKH